MIDLYVSWRPIDKDSVVFTNFKERNDTINANELNAREVTRGRVSERGKKRRRRAGVAMPRRLCLRPPATRTVIDSDSGAGADELCNSTSRKN